MYCNRKGHNQYTRASMTMASYHLHMMLCSHPSATKWCTHINLVHPPPTHTQTLMCIFMEIAAPGNTLPWQPLHQHLNRATKWLRFMLPSVVKFLSTICLDPKHTGHPLSRIFLSFFVWITRKQLLSNWCHVVQKLQARQQGTRYSRPAF